MITHVVMWKFKPDTEKEMHAFLDGLQALKGVIPQIRDLQVHVSCNPANEFDAMLWTQFDSMEDLQAYQTDPRHIAAGQIGKASRETRASLDFEE